MTESSTGPADYRTSVHRDDDDEFDLRPYLLAIWRRRAVILMVTVICGAVAAAYTFSGSAQYDATSRIYVGEPGSTAHAEVLGKIRLLAADPALSTRLLSEPGAPAGDGLDAATLQAATSSRPASPANALLVTVRLANAPLAAQASQALAARVVKDYREQSARKQEALEADLAKAEQDMAVAMKAALDFTLEKRMRQRREARELIAHHRQELSDTVVQMASERARLKAAGGDARITSEARIALAGLEARHGYLSRLVAEGDSTDTLKELAEHEQQQDALDAEIIVAQRLRNDRKIAVNAARIAASSTALPPTLFDTVPPEAIEVGRNASRNIGSATVLGLVLAIAGVVGWYRWFERN